MFKPCRFGKYYLLERIAVGGMAEIYKARLYGVDGFIKNMVVKQILPQYARHQQFIQMFVDEAKICSQLQHGNIVPVYELGQIDGVYFISMEEVDGKNLGELLDAGLDENDPLSIPHALYIACEILAGLDYAHRKNDEQGNPLRIVHRDVSPQNILISYEGEVKIVDFGIARAANKVHSTQAGVIKGKFGYMSPEQAMGHDVDARSDIFAAGILLYEMLTLERLFHGGTDVVTLERVKRADVPVPSRSNPRLPAELDALVFKALARDPRDRYQSAGQLRLDLSRILYNLPEEASAQTLSEYMKRLFAAEISRRQETPQPEPPAEVKQELIRLAGRNGVAETAQPAAGPAPEAAGAELLASAPAVGDAPAPVLPADAVPGSDDDDLDLSFSYSGRGRRLKLLLGLGLLALLVTLGVVFRATIARTIGIVSDVVEESADRLARKKLGTLLIRSRPSGAAVYFDNRKVGTTNMRIRNIDPDREYELVLTMEGFNPWSRKILPADWKQGKKMEIVIFKDWQADRFK